MWRDAIEQRWTDEIAVFMSRHLEATPIDDQIRALGGAAVDITCDFGVVRGSDQRPHLRALVVRGADLHLRDFLLDAGKHVVRDRVADEHGHGDRHAALASGTVRGADQRVGGHLRIGIRHHDRMILRPAQRLHAFAVCRSGRVDVLGDRRRADEAHRLHIRMREQCVDRLLVAVDHIEGAVGQPRFLEQRGQDQRCRRIALRGFQHERVAASKRHREHPQRHHRRKVEWRDAGDHAQRLTQRIRIDAGADVVAEFTLQELRRATRVLDDFDAARKFAGSVGEHFAMLTRDHRDNFLGALLEQRLELEHYASAGERGRRCPAGECGLRRLDGARDFAAGRERNAAT